MTAARQGLWLALALLALLPATAAAATANLQFGAASSSYAESHPGVSTDIQIFESPDTAAEGTFRFVVTGGTATPGEDFTITDLGETITHNSGTSGYGYRFQVTNDTVDEPDETVVLQLVDATGDVAFGEPSTMVLTIEDDDPPGAEPTPTPTAGPAAPPTNSAPPSFTGRVRPGFLLRVAPGTWTGADRFEYRFERCLGTACTPVADFAATDAQPLFQSDAGARFRATVRASNAAGSTSVAVPVPSAMVPVVESDQRCEQLPLTPGADSDGDGLSDIAECALTATGLNLAQMGATPLRADVFVEVDAMPGFRPSNGALAQVRAAFAKAPVSNPDGTTGIDLYVDNGSGSPLETGRTWGRLTRASEIPLESVFGAGLGGDYDWTRFDRAKARSFAAERRGSFRYALSVRQLGVAAQGVARATGNFASAGQVFPDFVVGLALITDGTPQVLNDGAQAGVFMHELGHTLGLGHGGRSGGAADHVNGKPNHLSVMNYRYLTGLLAADGSRRGVDFSRFDEDTVAPLNENALVETGSLARLPAAEGFGIVRSCRTQFGAFSAVFTPIAGPFDWDCNPATRGTSADVNGDGQRTVLQSREEWGRLLFAIGGIGDQAVLGQQAPPPVRTSGKEPTPTDIARALQTAARDRSVPALRTRVTGRRGARRLRVTVRDDRGLSRLVVRVPGRRGTVRRLKGRRATVTVKVPRGARRVRLTVVDATERKTARTVRVPR